MSICIPEAMYGVLQQNRADNEIDRAVEQVLTLGYAVLDSGYSAVELDTISVEFNRARTYYLEVHGAAVLKNINEHCTIRSPMTLGYSVFFQLAFNNSLMSALKKLILGKFILNQQNGIINPPKESYNQGAWHRDLPYQHFVSSRPLAINALFCVDDFTVENGATFVLPASHKIERFPSMSFIRENALQVQAKAGSFILLDCMVFHAGGFNTTTTERRAVNHVYNIPYFKQQINIPNNIDATQLSQEEKDILGFSFMEPQSVREYLSHRKTRLMSEEL